MGGRRVSLNGRNGTLAARDDGSGGTILLTNPVILDGAMAQVEARSAEMATTRDYIDVDGTPDRKLVAEAWVHARRQRDKAFPGNLFADPAWDILLDLYIAYCEGRRLPVSSVCVAANVPSTTALRWITILEHHQLVSRQADDRDGRRKLLSLTVEAVDRVEAALDGAAGSDRKKGLGRLRVAN